MGAKKRKTIDVDGTEVSISSPDKVFFPQLGVTKVDLIDYYLHVAAGALRGAGGRPCMMKRYPDGAEGKFFFQKRVPKSLPAYVDSVTLRYASGRSANEAVLPGKPALAWMVHMGCLDLNPHQVRADDLEHPDELRVDLDPMPGATWADVREVALVVRGVLEDLGLAGFPKTSGSRGMHVLVRIQRRWTFPEVRKASEAIAREVAQRAPHLATARWWKEERRGVFVDYNQNAKDRTVASAYSVRPTPDGRVSTPLFWSEVADCDPAAFTLTTVPARFDELGDPAAGLDDENGDLTAALTLFDEQDAQQLHPRPARPPTLEVARAETKPEVLAALDQWKSAHPQVAAHLLPIDELVDPMRGRSTLWWRVRINLQHVPTELRPEQGPLVIDYDPWAAFRR